jgi:diamine N-acetyltransferase
MELQKANISDIPVIILLAKEIWWEHYPSIIGEEQVNFMLDLMYSAEALEKQMQEKGHQFFLIKENEKAIGFASVAEPEIDELFINKFYILQQEQGRSLGIQVYEEILKLFSSKKKVRLTVNRQNYKSINFYFKLGFKIEKVIDVDISNGFQMNDFVMLHILS